MPDLKAPDFIPDDEAAKVFPEPAPGGAPPDFIPDSDFVADEDKYAGPVEGTKAFLEGAGRGATFGLSTAAETALGVKGEDIEGRRQAHPFAAPAGEMAGIAASSLIPGVGEANLLREAGEGTAAALGLGAEGAGILSKIGSGAVKSAVESMMVQGGDEISKMLADPTRNPGEATQTAAINVGLSGLMGGILGGGFAAINPLWKAAGGEKVTGILDSLAKHAGGIENVTNELPEAASADAAIPEAMEADAKPRWEPFGKNWHRFREIELGDAAKPEVPGSPLSEAKSWAPAPQAPEVKIPQTAPAPPVEPPEVNPFLDKMAQKIADYLPASAVGMATMAVGHNPALSFIVGALAKAVGRDTSDAIKPAILKFLSTAAPVDSEGFKAMVEFIHHTIEGESALSRAAKNVFQLGSDVLPRGLLPKEQHRRMLQKILETTQTNPDALFNVGDKTAHYLPQQGTSMAELATTAANYLGTMKPAAQRPSPLDREIEPSDVDMAKYHRQLDIAEQPLIVLEHIARGTLQPQDIATVKAIYPELYNRMAKKLNDGIIESVSRKEMIPYEKRMSLSLFLGQPLDSTMTPEAILANQALFAKNKGKAAAAAEAQAPHKSMANLSKSAQMARTPLQAADARRAGNLKA